MFFDTNFLKNEKIQLVLEKTAELPEDNEMRLEDGETHKCIYRFDLRRDLHD